MDLGPRVEFAVSRIVDSRDQAEAARLLRERCGDELPDADGADQVERIRLAALRLSCGGLAELTEWIAQARADWREVLVAAGFDDDREAHRRWAAALGSGRSVPAASV